MSKKEKFKTQFETGKDFEKKTFSKDDYLKQALENFKITSRTAKGKIDTTVSAEKTEKIEKGLDEEEIIKKATANYKEAIE